MLVIDDLVIAISDKVNFLNISTPSDPVLLSIGFDIQYRSHALTNYGNIVLFYLDNFGQNFSIMKIDLAINSTSYTEIDNWYMPPIHMKLTNDTLFSSTVGYYGHCDFLVHNATNLDNLTLLGNTSLTRVNYNSDFLVHDNFVYFISQAKNLLVYEINSSYQLSFIREYSFAQLESLYFHENYLFACDNFGFQLFDYSIPSNLVYVTHYNISSAQSIRIRNNIAYLTTSNSFTTLSLDNFLDIQIIDRYNPGKSEDVEMWKIELSDNLAVILTKEIHHYDYSNRYGGYLYIFDISSPSNIERLFPDKIQLIEYWDLFKIQWISVIIIIVITVIITPIIIWINNKKKKLQKKMDQVN